MNERKHGFIRCIITLIIVALSAFLASLAFLGKYVEYGLPFLAFFYLIPVFYIKYTSSYRTVWLYGLEYGFLFYWFYNYWLAGNLPSPCHPHCSDSRVHTVRSSVYCNPRMP